MVVRETRSDAKNEKAAENASDDGVDVDGEWADAGAFGVQRQCRKQRTRRIGCSLSSIRAQSRSWRIAVRGCSHRGLGLSWALVWRGRCERTGCESPSSRARPMQQGVWHPHLSDFTVQLSKHCKLLEGGPHCLSAEELWDQQHGGAQQCRSRSAHAAICHGVSFTSPVRTAHALCSLAYAKPKKSRSRTLGLQC